MSSIAYIKRYTAYLLKAKTKYYLHSPFVFYLMSEVIQDSRHFYAYDEIDALRNNLLKSTETITVDERGAGSKKMGQQRQLKDIAKYAAVSTKKGKLLFNLVNHFSSKSILELGTSLGLGTAYLAKVNPANHITTIEACQQTAKLAHQNFQQLGLKNVSLIIDTFETALPKLVEENKPFDVVYFDGNHQKEATLNYFNTMLKLKHENSIFVFDDINWSSQMNEAWKQIIHHNAVTLSIDLFHVGLVFFKNDQAKQHFQLYF